MKTKNLKMLLLVFILKSTAGSCTVHTITTSGYTFSPDSVSAILGDTVLFSISTFHFPVEVSQATWNANGNTSNGGFQLPPGGGMVVLGQVKTYYYVCGVHYSMGMKGRIFVTNPTGINSIAQAKPELEISVNNALEELTVRTSLPGGKQSRLRIFNSSGINITSKENISPAEHFDTSRIPAGIYFVEINCEDMMLVRRFVISR